MKVIKRIIAALLLCFVCVAMSACGAEDNARLKKTATFTTPDGELVEVVVDDWMTINSGMIKLYLEDGSWIMVGTQNVLLRQEVA
ncbi:MAG: hypothetical protein IJY78_08280 [Bacteroidaceae bacterium]|nr:hypothetical protein [Bacteroidaceae bacterium]